MYTQRSQAQANILKMSIVRIKIYIPVILLLIITTPTSGDDWTSSCPSNCTCKWTNGKKSAICSSLHLTTIPTTLSTEVQVVVLNDNHIPYLNREEFTTLGLVNLQRIYLKKSDVQYIHKEAFKNLKILVEIDLSDNKIEMLDKDTFSGNDRLRILYLNGNPIKRLVAYQFPTLPHLRSLDLHDCLINYIDPLAFANLNLLEFLYLKNNLLENLSEYVFQHMTNLKTLVLDENPWLCNCKLRKFRNWYVKSKVRSISLTCKGPFHHKDKHWENIDEEHFGCPPKVEIFSNEDVQNIDIGSNTTFSCLVSGDPMPTVIWELNGKSFDNDNVLFDEEVIGSEKLWNNLTVFNMTSLDAGTYSCSAQNVIGSASQNISIYLTEIVQHVLVKTPETFWYFGLIMGTFGTVFLLILISFVVCLCKRARRRRNPSKNIKGSVSFNDQEKKLLDLSITTTNDRQDSCGIDNNTPSINKTESVIAFEPIEITVENRGGIGIGSGIGTVSAAGCASGLGVGGGCANAGGIVGLGGNIGGGGGSGGGGNMVQHEEFPLNVGVFPPPPEFCSNVVANPAYGNIFISVSVTQDMIDSSDINIYPDLLNIPKRVDSGAILPVNVSSFATLPRNHRRGILKKDSNLYPHDEIVSYHNLDTTYAHQTSDHHRNPSSAAGNAVASAVAAAAAPSSSSSSTTTSTCMNCMKAQTNPYVKDETPSSRQCTTIQGPCLLKYDNMGRRITASGNSTLSLPDEERMENETLFNEKGTTTLQTFIGQPTPQTQSSQHHQHQGMQQHSHHHPQQQQQQQMATTAGDRLSTGSDFVSL